MVSVEFQEREAYAWSETFVMSTDVIGQHGVPIEMILSALSSFEHPADWSTLAWKIAKATDELVRIVSIEFQEREA